jgi:hypothetical protein
MIPVGSNYPTKIDTDDNLFLVHDSLRVRLLYDYNPGDESITIEDVNDSMKHFPDTGIITLTEQCSDLDERAISLYYGSKTSTTFDKLEILPNFKDVIKLKKITNVTMNVLDKHHNHLKDALINYDESYIDPIVRLDHPKGGIQHFAGIIGKTAGSYDPTKTLTERINFLKNLAYSPKAWLSCDKTFGTTPLEVNFISESLKTQDLGDVTYVWNFGDGSGDVNGNISVINNPKIQHTFSDAGVYDIELNVSNKYGSDDIVFKELITAKIQAPEEAIINIIPKSNQIFDDDTTPPTIRSPINTLIELEVPQGIRNALEPHPHYSYAGELLKNPSNEKIDPIEEYTWNLGDELVHENTYFTKASYSIGGYYDVTLRVDTTFGSYRITSYKNSIDIVEMQNLWLFNYNTKNNNDGGLIETYEFGLISETFKTQGTRKTKLIDRSNGFLGVYDSSEYNENTFKNAKKEFRKNVLFTTHGVDSGDKGDSLLFYASGGDVSDNKQIKIENYNAFSDSYNSLNSIDSRSWNWVGLANGKTVDFILGKSGLTEANSNFAVNKRLTYNIQGLTSISKTLTNSDFENGAQEVLQHPSYFESGIPTNGYFATYRSTWKNNSGYILRNSSVNEFFRISNFYRTNGTSSSPYNTLTKLPDLTSLVKVEGELVALSNGVFLFDNTGEIAAWNDVSLTWEVGKTSSASLSFRSLQDSSAVGFDDKSNTLLAASDGDRTAYLSYDYSKNAFIKFNGTDLTFSSLGSRYTANTFGQFKLGIY